MIRRLLLTIAVMGGASSIAVGSASAAPCADSNGAKPGGSVYWAWNIPLACSVNPPQRLHYLRVQSASQCASFGGHGWVPAHRICWDVDY